MAKNKVMEVLYEMDENTYYGVFKEHMWDSVIDSFFIEGNVPIPKHLSSRTISNLKEDDYIEFFQELQYHVLGISEFDSEIHIPCLVGNLGIIEEMAKC